jgi:aminomethyltransferase
MTQPLLRTPLYDTHLQFGARMVEFAGWEMPVQYRGIVEEHNHTRTACSVFDVSHMGRLKLTGKDCESFLNRICTRNLKDAEVGRSFYSHICREDGGILDDVIVSRFEDRWGIVCNASNREKIIAWLRSHLNGQNVEIADETMTTAMVACQGPKTVELAQQLTGADLSGLKRYHFTVRPVGAVAVVTYRSGYTGEDGLEVVIPAGLTPFLVPQLLGTPKAPHPVIRPAGLGARDTLRIEAAMPLYGHELSEDWDSLTAGQGWCVDLEKDFVGAQALRKVQASGVPRRLVGLELDGRRIARQHAAVFAGPGRVGEVTSGTLSPTLGKSIAMAIVPDEHSTEGGQLEVEVGGKRVPAWVVKLPFYKRPRSG